MTRARILAGLAGLLVTVGVAWVLFIGLPRWTARPAPSPEETGTASPAAPQPATEPSAPRIKARLYYLSDDGMRLKAAEREVPLGADPVAQARAIVEAQLEPPPNGFVTAIPGGTTLRQVFISQNGEAYVDLSGEIVKNHPGGSLDEILTVYTLVDAITDNLPAVSSVQILIDGREVDTLAGHVDLRRPLAKNLTWVEPGKPGKPD